MKKIADFFVSHLAAILLFGIPVGGAALFLAVMLFGADTPSDREIRDYAEMYREEWYNDGYREGYDDGYSDGYDIGREDGLETGRSNERKEAMRYIDEAIGSINEALEIVDGTLSDPDAPIEDYRDFINDALYDALAWLDKAGE